MLRFLRKLLASFHKPADRNQANQPSDIILERDPASQDEQVQDNLDITSKDELFSNRHSEPSSKIGVTHTENAESTLSIPEIPESPTQAVLTSTETAYQSADEVVNDLPLIPEETPEQPAVVARYEALPPYEPKLDLRDYSFPPLDLLEIHGRAYETDPVELEANKNQIIQTLQQYDIGLKKVTATVGPSVTLYEITPLPGVRLAQIKQLEKDLELSLAANDLKVISLPAKGTIGIEVTNKRRSVVSLRDVFGSDSFRNTTAALPFAIGKGVYNDIILTDLSEIPALLIAGESDSGKSVCLHVLISSLLYKKHPSQVKLALIDLKKVELNLYQPIEHHFLAKLPGMDSSVITDSRQAIQTLNALCIELDNRMDLLKEAGTRTIKEYNSKFIKRQLNPQKGHQYLPFLFVIIDEFKELYAADMNEIELPLFKIAKDGYRVGIHTIVATNDFSRGQMRRLRDNFKTTIAFKLPSRSVALAFQDEETPAIIAKKGEMWMSHNSELTQIFGAYIETEEIERIVDFIADQRGYPQAYLLPEYVSEYELEKFGDFDISEKDPLLEDAAKLIVQFQLGSTSLLQRRMKLGYNRAGRLMDQLERTGVVGPNLGSKAREVLFKTESELMEHLSMFL